MGGRFIIGKSPKISGCVSEHSFASDPASIYSLTKSVADPFASWCPFALLP